MIGGAATVLGAAGGYLIASSVPDETEWYPKWFSLAALILGLAAGALSAYEAIAAQQTLLFWTAILGAGLFVYATGTLRTPLVALAAALLSIAGGILAWQATLLALIPATGYLYSKGARKQLWWFALTPTIITFAALLS